jgi:hypothetical protein
VATPVLLVRHQDAPRTASRPTPTPPPGLFDPLVAPFSLGRALPAGWSWSGELQTGPDLASIPVTGPGDAFVRITMMATRAHGFGAPAVSSPVRIGSHQGRRGAYHDGQAVVWQVDPTRWVRAVGYGTSADTVVLIAQQVRDDADEHFTCSYRLSHLPAGFTVRGGLRNMTGGSANTWSELYLSDQPPTATDPPLVRVMVAPAGQFYGGRVSHPNTTVQGRPARFSTLAAGYTWIVLEFYLPGGEYVSIMVQEAIADRVPKADMVRIGEGLRLAGDPDDPRTWTDQPVG